MKILIFSTNSRGGIADYAHDQANAIAKLGAEVSVVCPPEFIEGRKVQYAPMPILENPRPAGDFSTRLKRRLWFSCAVLKNMSRLYRIARQEPGMHILTHFEEYLAPLWAWRLRDLHRYGVFSHTILHDPIRDYRVGPKWWHDWSVRSAFGALNTVFVHGKDRGDTPSGIRVIHIPYGIHDYPDSTRAREDVRRELGIPADARLITSFGYIRDNKNLDLVIEALARIPEIVLLVAGSEMGCGNKPVAYYKALAEHLGCAHRIIWRTTFLSDQDVAAIMGASDLSILTYAREFVSSSAAQSVAMRYRVPCLVSGGNDSSREAIERYEAGIWVEPGSSEAIESGLRKWLTVAPKPDWDGYHAEYSWGNNARIVLDAMASTTRH